MAREMMYADAIAAAISEEMQLRLSSMQVDIFALVTEARQRVAEEREPDSPVLGLGQQHDQQYLRLPLSTVSAGG